MLNDIIKFKVHVQKSLEDYEGFVVEEVEEELGCDADDDEGEGYVDGGEVTGQMMMMTTMVDGEGKKDVAC